MLRKIELQNSEGVLYWVFGCLVVIRKVKLMECELNANANIDYGVIVSGFVSVDVCEVCMAAVVC